jgi:hypothetical protein
MMVDPLARNRARYRRTPAGNLVEPSIGISREDCTVSKSTTSGTQKRPDALGEVAASG